MSLSCETEEWRDVVGYEGLYQVSNLGRVRSVDHYDRRGRLREGRVKKATIGTIGYPVVNLRKDGVAKTCYVHRLIAEAFIQNPNGYGYVDHINGVKADSTLSNLRWCTKSDNYMYAVELGIIDLEEKAHRLHSEKAKAAHVAAVGRPVIRDDGKRYATIADAARDVGCCESAVWRVVNGLRKTTRGHSFRYANDIDLNTAEV